MTYVNRYPEGVTVGDILQLEGIDPGGKVLIHGVVFTYTVHSVESQGGALIVNVDENFPDQYGGKSVPATVGDRVDKFLWNVRMSRNLWFWKGVARRVVHIVRHRTLRPYPDWLYGECENRD